MFRANNYRSYLASFIQMDCELFDVPRNLAKAEFLIREAAGMGSSLVCLPEAFNTGYLNSAIPELKKYAEPIEGITVRTMSALAKELGVIILVPILLEVDRGVENSAILIDEGGCVAGSYSKTHLIGEEVRHFQRGSDYPVFDTKLGAIGVSICYDVCFPETARILALKGADVILVPSAWRASSYFKEWWDLNISCRALDNLVYVGAANRCGPAGKESFAGKSKLCGPVGDVVCELDAEEEGAICGEIDLARLRREREFNTVMFDRHPEDYGLVSKAIARKGSV